MRKRAKLASAAVESFLRWSFMLESSPETAVKLMRKARSRDGRSDTDPSPILVAGASDALNTISRCLAEAAAARARALERRRAERHISFVAYWAARNVLEAFGHPEPSVAEQWEETREWRRKIDAAVDAAMGRGRAHGGDDPEPGAPIPPPTSAPDGDNVVPLFSPR